MQLQLEPLLESATEWAAALRSGRTLMHACSGPAGHAKRAATPLLWQLPPPWIEPTEAGRPCNTAIAVQRVRDHNEPVWPAGTQTACHDQAHKCGQRNINMHAHARGRKRNRCGSP